MARSTVGLMQNDALADAIKSAGKTSVAFNLYRSYAVDQARHIKRNRERKRLNVREDVK